MTTDRYTLYCAPNTYALIAHAVLEETAVPYAVRRVALFADVPDPDFLKVSPLGRVPALDGPDGPIFESGAIALYLAERHPEAGLVIPAGDPRRGRFLQWIHYFASTLQPEVLIQFHPEFYFSDEATQEKLKSASQKRLEKILAAIEDALTPGPFLFGEQRTVCDYCLAMQTIWPPVFPGSISDYPNIERLTDKISERPAVQRVRIMQEETWAGAAA